MYPVIDIFRQFCHQLRNQEARSIWKVPVRRKQNRISGNDKWRGFLIQGVGGDVLREGRNECRASTLPPPASRIIRRWSVTKNQLYDSHNIFFLSFVRLCLSTPLSDSQPFSPSTSMEPALSRTAIALNNMGVELLHRHLFSEALATLHDATRVMKQVLTDEPISDEWNMLRRAQLRLCQPSVFSANNYPVFVDLTDDPFSFLNFMKNTQLHHQNILYTIRISDIDTVCYEDLDMQSAILLYNTGLANHFSMQSQTNMATLMKLADNLLQQITPEECELFVQAATIQLAIWHCCSTIPQLSHLSKELSPRACELEAMLLPHDAMSAAAAWGHLKFWDTNNAVRSHKIA